MDGKQENTDNWPKYSIFILSELKRLSENDRAILKNQNDMKLEIALLKAKSITWGSVAGFIGAAFVMAGNYVAGKL